MLHQYATFELPTSASEPSLDDDGRPIFDAAAYVDALRAVGVELHPVRGAPGALEVDGTFTVAVPAEPAARRRVAAIEKAFAPQLAADRLAVGRVAEHLLLEAATRRFAAIVDDDWAVALRELTRLKDAAAEAAARENDALPDTVLAADLAGEAYVTAFDFALQMPIRRAEDVRRKAEFALRFCDVGAELQKVLAEVATFDRPDLAGTLSASPLIAA